MKNFPSIKKNEDFRKVYRFGKSAGSSRLVMYILKNGTDHNRIGISVSKKIGNSIIRHRSARMFREAFRLNNDHILPGYDIVVVLKDASLTEKYVSTADAFLKLCAKHGILL